MNPSSFLCVCSENSQRTMMMRTSRFFLLNILNITFIYNKVLNIIKNNKFINKYLIFNNKLTTSFFAFLQKTKILNLDSNLDSNFNLGFQLGFQLFRQVI